MTESKAGSNPSVVEVTLLHEVPHVSIRAVGVYTLKELDALLESLRAAAVRAERVAVAVAAALAPTEVTPSDGPVAKWYVHIDDVGVVWVSSDGYGSIGTVLKSDWSHPEVREAYGKYGRHIGKRLKYPTGERGSVITAFSYREDRGVYINYGNGSWDRLAGFDKYEVVE